MSLRPTPIGAPRPSRSCAGSNGQPPPSTEPKIDAAVLARFLSLERRIQALEGRAKDDFGISQAIVAVHQTKLMALERRCGDLCVRMDRIDH